MQSLNDESVVYVFVSSPMSGKCPKPNMLRLEMTIAVTNKMKAQISCNLLLENWSCITCSKLFISDRKDERQQITTRIERIPIRFDICSSTHFAIEIISQKAEEAQAFTRTATQFVHIAIVV